MTQQDIYDIAMRQSAIDSGCDVSDFTAGVPKVFISQTHPDARRYLKLPFYCDLCSYGSNVVASVHPDVAQAVRDYISRFPPEHCFETPNLHVLSKALREHSYEVCFMAEYWLPDLAALIPQPCAYELRVLMPDDFEHLYLPVWSNALCEKRKHLDRMALGAYDGEKLVALAGASADCETMWQIGVDVLPTYRRQGIASALTSRLALEILARDKVPFYCCAWSNLPSARNAIRSGFRPAWVQVSAKSLSFIEELNA